MIIIAQQNRTPTSKQHITESWALWGFGRRRRAACRWLEDCRGVPCEQMKLCEKRSCKRVFAHNNNAGCTGNSSWVIRVYLAYYCLLELMGLVGLTTSYWVALVCLRKAISIFVYSENKSFWKYSFASLKQIDCCIKTPLLVCT